MPKRSRGLRAGGFTLVELLVALAIIGVLVGLLAPAIQSVRESGRRLRCQHRLRQLGLALHNYHDVHQVLPPGALMKGPAFPTESGWGWCSMILPHLEQQGLHAQIDFGEMTGVGRNASLLSQSIPLSRCPSDPAPARVNLPLANVGGTGMRTVAHGNYAGVACMLSGMSAVRFGAVTDGLSQTAMLGERVYQAGSSAVANNQYTSPWFGAISVPQGTLPNTVPYLLLNRTPVNYSRGNPGAFTSYHQAGAFFAFGDGSVHLIVQTLDPKILSALGTANGGEPYSLP